MAYTSNAPTKKLSPGQGKITSPLRDTVKSGVTTTKRDK